MDEEQAKRFTEAQKDTEWIKKIRMARTADELVRLFSEKGLDLKEKISAYPINQTRALNDEELDEVAGGGWSVCLHVFIPVMCKLCESIRYDDSLGTQQHCALGYWQPKLG